MALRPKGESKRVTKELTVLNSLGLHARPAARFVRTVHTFRSEMWVISNETRYHAGRIMDLLMANLDRGAVFILEAEGPDADAAIARMEQLMIELRDTEDE
jgi:phosphocarrier protein